MAFFGFSACAEMAAEYGTPHAEFEIKGKVTDEQKVPLNGIAVVYDDQFHGSDTLYTDQDGRFLLQGTMFPREEMKLTFVDKDGELNGGLFETKSVEVALNQVEANNGAWDFGKFDGEVEVELKKAE